MMSDREPMVTQSMLAGETPPVRWATACQALAAGGTYWLATARPDGRPHVVPVLAVWVEGTLHFAAGERTRKAKNLAHDPHCVLALTSQGLDLVVEGHAAKVREEARLRRVADVYASKYDWRVSVRAGALDDAEGAPTAGPPPYEVYEVIPSAAYAFGTDEETAGAATRWRF